MDHIQKKIAMQRWLKLEEARDAVAQQRGVISGVIPVVLAIVELQEQVEAKLSKPDKDVYFIQYRHNEAGTVCMVKCDDYADHSRRFDAALEKMQENPDITPTAPNGEKFHTLDTPIWYASKE